MSRFERPNIQHMHGYTWGEQPNDAKTIKLNTNENPMPPSPQVQLALADISADALRTYPQPTADPLRDTLAALHGVQRNNVVITNGGDEALRLAFTTFAGPGALFGMANPSYSLYPVLADIADVTLRPVDLQDDWRLPGNFSDDLVDANLVCVVNPHAPSGTLLSVDDLQHVAAALNGILLIDEAYVDFVDPSLRYQSESLLELDNVLILRTFSKGYSLAGLRLGYLLGHASLIGPIVDKTRDSYNVNHISQQIGLAAISDQAYARSTWDEVRRSRSQLQANLNQLDLPSPPTQTNFILVTVGRGAKLNAQALYEALKERGILVRHFTAERLSDKLRITVGTQEQNQALLTELTDLLS